MGVSLLFGNVKTIVKRINNKFIKDNNHNFINGNKHRFINGDNNNFIFYNWVGVIKSMEVALSLIEPSNRRITK